MGWLLRELMALLSPRFPPAALALQQLGKSDDVTEGGTVPCLFLYSDGVFNIPELDFYCP